MSVDGRRRRIGLVPVRHLLPGGTQILVHALAPPLAAEPAFAVPAETGRGVELVRAVDPDRARLDAWRDVEREVDAFRPYGRGKPVARVVCELDRLRRCTERHQHDDRPEDLDLGDRRGWRDRKSTRLNSSDEKK